MADGERCAPVNRRIGARHRQKNLALQIAHPLNVGDRWGAAFPSLLGSRVLLNTREVVEKQLNVLSIRTSFVEGFVEETTVPRSVGDSQRPDHETILV